MSNIVGDNGEPIDGVPASEGQEQLLLGKFKSQEDLVKAYSELEGKIGEQGRELGQLRETVEYYNRIAQEPPMPQYVEPNLQGQPVSQQFVPFMQEDNNGVSPEFVNQVASRVLQTINPVIGTKMDKSMEVIDLITSFKNANPDIANNPDYIKIVEGYAAEEINNGKRLGKAVSPHTALDLAVKRFRNLLKTIRDKAQEDLKKTPDPIMTSSSRTRDSYSQGSNENKDYDPDKDNSTEEHFDELLAERKRKMSRRR